MGPTNRPPLTGSSLVRLARTVTCLALFALAAPAVAQQDDPGPGDGLEELAGGQQRGQAPALQGQLSREELEALAAAAARRTPSTIEELRAFERRVKAAAAKAKSASVALITADGEESRRGAGSGTIISADGWIATAAHVGVEPGRKFSVVLADGTELVGVSAGQCLLRNEDVGLVKVDTGGRDLPFAPIGSGLKLATGEPLLVFGHPLGPELKPWRPPPLRVGHVLSVQQSAIGIDAPVNSGDSGGGVFDLDGRLVGITSVASNLPDVNACIAIESLATRLEDLKKNSRIGERQGPNGELNVMIDLDAAMGPLSRLSKRARRDTMQQALSDLMFNASGSVVTIMVDSRAAALGVVVDDQGHVLTKASEIGMGPAQVQVAMPDGVLAGAKRIAADSALDLMLIATGQADNDPIVFADVDPEWGSLLISMGPGIAPEAVGVRSLGPYNAGASDQACRAYLGVGLEAVQDGAGARVAAVMEGSAAADAGMRVGDVLRRVDGVEMSTPDSAGAVLRAHAPGDTIEVQFDRDGVERTEQVRLQRPWVEGGPGNYGVALSRRATGFGPVIQHDGVVAAESMGGPIIDLEGRVVGLNIARADRTKTYALPSSVVKTALARMLEAAARGENVEPEDMLAKLKPVKVRSDGRAVLGASAAHLFGPTLAARGDDDFLALEGWTAPEDAAMWVLDVPAMGPYDFVLDVRSLLGGTVDLFVGNEVYSVTLAPGDPTDETAFSTVRVAEVLIEQPGPVLVRVQPLDRPRGPLMRLREVRVARLDTLRMFEKALPIMRFSDPERFRREMERKAARERAEEANRMSEDLAREAAKKEAENATPAPSAPAPAPAPDADDAK